MSSSGSPSPTEPDLGVRRPWWRRPLRLALVTVGTLVALVVLWLVGLLLTNPSPSASQGWARHADVPGGRGESASAVRGDELLVIGGFVGLGGTSSAVEVYDAEADTWTTGPDLPSSRHHLAAATIGRTVYASGGASGVFDWAPQSNLWVLDDGADGWEEAEPMPEGRYGHDMVALDGRLYVVGGHGDTTRVLVFEPGEGWSAGAELGQERDHVRATVVGGEVWALGGRGDALTDAVSVYDPAADEWSEGPPLPEAVSAMAVGVLDGAVHVVGGEDPSLFGGRVFDWHFVLPRGSTSWEDGPAPILAVHGASYGVVGDRLLIAGGSPRQGPLSPLAWSEVTQSHGADAGR